ncbi:MAG TPA: hypothetical protein VFE53_22845 [Mucilaginibacter sp.]|jgi:hypothetical protein|nr:hypothetical protein [Mucilaginibacter sp.]
MEIYVNELLAKLRDAKVRKVLPPPKRKLSTATCLKGFQAYLNQLTATSVKKDHSGNASYVIGALFKNERAISKDVDLYSFAKVTIALANRKFNDVVAEIEATDPKISNYSIRRCSDLIHEFIFDVRPFVEYFERKKNPEFVLFKGWKSYHNSTSEIFLISNNLYWNGLYKQNIFDRKMATNIAVFTLRQALELKFKRLCGVFDVLTDDRDGVKIRHDYFPGFINENSDLFFLPDMNVTDLLRVYKWTNNTIHNAANPRIWELRFAQDFCRPLFTWGTYTDDAGETTSSTNGAVVLKDLGELKKRLISSIRSVFSTARYMEFMAPECILLTDGKLVKNPKQETIDLSLSVDCEE